MGLINGTTIEVLNLEKILVGYFAGSYLIFWMLAFAAFAILAARWRIPNLVFISLFGVLILLMANYGLGLMYLLVGVALAIVIGFTLIKAFNR